MSSGRIPRWREHHLPQTVEMPLLVAEPQFKGGDPADPANYAAAARVHAMITVGAATAATIAENGGGKLRLTSDGDHSVVVEVSQRGDCYYAAAARVKRLL